MREVYVFDLDGTLIDSMPRFSKAMTSILDEEGVPYGEDLVKTVTPLGYRKTAAYYVHTLGVQKSEEEIVARIEQKLYREYSECITLKPGVRNFLTHLQEKGARLFVLTASPHLVTDVCLEHNGIDRMFEKVWSVEDFGLTKSDTRIFHTLARTVGCNEKDVHYFDDNPIAVQNAKKAGLHTYGVMDIQSEEELDVVKQHADVFVRDFTELL